jgi:hypothetical protein
MALGNRMGMPPACGRREDVCDGITQNINMEQDNAKASFFTRA